MVIIPIIIVIRIKSVIRTVISVEIICVKIFLNLLIVEDLIKGINFFKYFHDGEEQNFQGESSNCSCN